MKTTQRRPSPRAVALAGVVWLGVLAIELARLESGQAIELGGIDLRQAVIAMGLLGVVAAVIDWRMLGERPAPTLRRIVPRSLALRTWSEIGLEVRTASPLGAHAELIDGVPERAEVEGLPMSLVADTTSVQRGSYRLRPLSRGDVHFPLAVLRADSPLGMWRYTAEIGENSEARVYPNFAATTRFDELVRKAQTREVGIRRHRRRGEGLEFHQLREYRTGDSIRQIDWKATSRKRELISREYEAEHDQRIVFLMDCSRRMRSQDGELSHFDHSLNAMILLAHVALKGGDAVGMLSFGKEQRWMPPSKGGAAVNELLHRVYDLEPTTHGVDFRGAAEALALRQRRRSMVILMTHLRGEDIEDLMPALRLLRRTHYVLVADLRQIEVDEALEGRPADLHEAFAAMGAWRSRLDRRQLHERLRAEGVRILDVSPTGLGPALVSGYYDAKRGGGL